jgi:outer membrane receptor protein involved in Fe transport
MSKLSLTLTGLLLATSALTAPNLVMAQEAAQPAPPAEGEVEEIIVLGRNIPEPMRETSEVATFLQPEDLKRAGDDTAAEALVRTTGLSVVGGKFVYVRGLGERYSSALLNGSPLPSPEPLQRVVPLDLFPSSILGGVTVQKTYSPNYPGEFGGGVIDLQTLATPDEPFLSIGMSVGGNTETTFQEGITYYGSDYDWLGYDDGTRDTPRILQRVTRNRLRVSEANYTDAELQQIGRAFVNAPLNLIQRKNQMPANFGMDISAGRSFDLGFGTLGVIAVVGYDNSWRNREGTQQEGIVQAGVISVNTDYGFRSTTSDVVVNGLAGLSLEVGDHRVRWTNLYIHSTSKEARIREGYDANAPGQGLVRDDYTEWFERSLISTQLAGDSEFGDFRVSWRGAFARTARNAPYEKGIRYRWEDTNGDGRRDADEYFHNGSSEQNYTRFGEVEDDVASFGVDGYYTLALSDERDIIFSGGVAWMDNNRAAVQREFRFLALNNAIPVDVQNSRVDYLLSDFNIGPLLFTLRETTGADGAAAYKAALESKAAWFQVDAEVIPLLRVAVGVRYEDATQSVTPFDIFGGGALPAPAPLDNQYWLPAATVTWNFYEDMQLRFGVSKTIARPQFRELAPQAYLDPDNDRLYIGNPYLVDSELLNLDARYEWYFKTGQSFTVGVFYKDIDKPVETIVNEGGSNLQTTFLNAPKAILYGAEIDVKAYFDLPFEASFFSDKRWLVAANYTWTQSEVQVEAGDVVYPLSGLGASRPATDYVTDGDQLQGQSEHLFNVQFGWEDDNAQSQATLLIGYVSERISARGRTGFPDLIQDPGVIVDFTYRKGFTVMGREMEFGFEARNLLGEDFEEFQELGGGRVDTNTYDLGRSFSFSLTARF